MNAQYQYPRFWLALFWLYLFIIFGIGFTPNAIIDHIHAEKIIHFVLFLCFGFLLEQLFVSSPRKLLLKAFVVAFFIELAQISLPSRSFEMTELLCSTLGAFVGIIISARACPEALLKCEQWFKER